ncbi:hypothetical protein [Psychroflexus montanilacus]|uniref:hypothetical protein n=1 Tax=Psychroflexus montanilacus TaxID=2873598 RepID=UPI001CC8FC06|nr:hypothetical protein [Psychroflexus montanilacus]MBZ9652552.1 hypothetical protein [Psychroflexus montanilacus]
MAKLKSLLKIEGTLDGMTFYKNQEGEYLVKTKSGVSKSRIQNDPAFIRTRENGQEFGHIAKSGKVFRRAIATLIADVQDRSKTYRLTSQLNEVKRFDTTSGRGERKVSIGIGSPEGKEALKFFDFNKKATLDAVLKSRYELDTVANEITLNGFTPRLNLGVPQGATHVELSAAMMNFHFSSGEGEVAMSNVENLEIDNTTANIALNFSSTPTAAGETYYFLKVAYFQEFNGQQYPLLNGAFNALQIIEIV